MTGPGTAARVGRLIAEHFDIPESKCEAGTLLVDDLGADSLDKVEFVMAAEQEFGCEIGDTEIEGIRTVADAIAAVEKALA